MSDTKNEAAITAVLQMMNQWYHDNKDAEGRKNATRDLIRSARDGQRLHMYDANAASGKESWSYLKANIRVGTGQQSWVGLVELMDATPAEARTKAKRLTAWPFIKALARTDCPYRMFIIIGVDLGRIQELLIVYPDVDMNQNKIRAFVPVCKFLWSPSEKMYKLYNITATKDVAHHHQD